MNACVKISTPWLDIRKTNEKIEKTFFGFLFIYIVCCFGYMLFIKIVTYIRRTHWEKASETEIVDKLLKILYLSDYNSWNFLKRRRHGLKNKMFTYSDIIEYYSILKLES
jgi:heme/copper-type cytochrome/quinol oxidase subunit 1